jgi:hypothetical protein
MPSTRATRELPTWGSPSSGFRTGETAPSTRQPAFSALRAHMRDPGKSHPDLEENSASTIRSCATDKSFVNLGIVRTPAAEDRSEGVRAGPRVLRHPDPTAVIAAQSPADRGARGRSGARAQDISGERRRRRSGDLPAKAHGRPLLDLAIELGGLLPGASLGAAVTSALTFGEPGGPPRLWGQRRRSGRRSTSRSSRCRRSRGAELELPPCRSRLHGRRRVRLLHEATPIVVEDPIEHAGASQREHETANSSRNGRLQSTRRAGRSIAFACSCPAPATLDGAQGPTLPAAPLGRSPSGFDVRIPARRAGRYAGASTAFQHCEPPRYGFRPRNDDARDRARARARGSARLGDIKTFSKRRTS